MFADREYSKDTEKARRKLHPILKHARSKSVYKDKCKLEGPNLIIKGRTYAVENLHQLPSDLSSFHVSSKSNDTVFGFFRELSPF